MMRYPALIAGAVVASALTASACGGPEQEQETARTTPVAVQVTPARVQNLPETIEVGGTVKSRSVAVLTSRIVGQVRKITTEPGARVRAGAVLAVLDGREMEANRERAEAMLTAAAQGQAAASADKAAADAALALATATHGRIAQLRERKSATQQELDEAEAALRSAQARAQAAAAAVSAAAANLSGARAAAEGARISAGYSRIVAPFAGIVTQRHLDPGAMTMPGTPVITMEQEGGFQVEVGVDESRAARVNWDAEPRVVLATPDGRNETTTGTVVERAFALDNSHTVRVKVGLPAGTAVRTGMYARVIFAGPSREALAVPVDALVQRGQLDALFVIEGETARYRVVETGQRAEDAVEIRSGLVAGERVVRRVPASLTDGTPVAPRGGQQ